MSRSGHPLSVLSELTAGWIAACSDLHDELREAKGPATAAPTLLLSRRALAPAVTFQVSRYRNMVNFGC